MGTSAWVELHADRGRLSGVRSDLSDDDNALILYLLDRPMLARKYQLGNGLLFDEGIDWCYADDDDAVDALRAAAALR